MPESVPAPSVSIICPTFNRAAQLPRAIKSVLNQSYSDFELIIVDDASTDDTARKVKEFAEPRIRYVCFPENRGAPSARNEGIRMARGKLISFQDSDDEWLPGKLQKQVEYLLSRGPETGLVYTRVGRIADGRRELLPAKPLQSGEPEFVHDKLLSGNFITIHTLVRRECFDKTGVFDEDLPRLQDWDLWLRISNHYRIGFIDEPLVDVHISDDAISKQDNKLAEAMGVIVEKYVDDFGKHPAVLAKHYYVIGRILGQEGYRERAAEFFKKACRMRPFNLKYFIYDKIFSRALRAKG